MILRNLLQEERRRRTVEVLKFRGAPHQRGEFPFMITSDQGIVVLPLSALPLTQRSSDVRVTSGIAALDAMCGGGIFRDGVILVSGATGTGKTLMATHFVFGGVEQGERALLLAFEESREQLLRNAQGWGMDLAPHEAAGRLRIVPMYPHAMSIEDHLVRVRREIEDFAPQRVALDSLSALERVTTLRAFREFVINLTSYLKHKEITTLFTSTTSSLTGGDSVTEKHISTLTDMIVLLRYVEREGVLGRSLVVLKMRGSPHDHTIRSFDIGPGGLQLGEALRGIAGVVLGPPRFAGEREEGA